MWCSCMRGRACTAFSSCILETQKETSNAANRISAATPGIQQVVKRRNPDQLNDIMKSRSRYFKDEVVSAQ